MKLSDLRPTKGATHKRKRVGRGYSSGHGGHESTRGTKGQNSRSGGGTRLGHEGGQTPIWMRFPKRGFTNYTRIEYTGVNVDTLNELFDAGQEVGLEDLRERGLIRGRGGTCQDPRPWRALETSHRSCAPVHRRSTTED